MNKKEYDNLNLSELCVEIHPSKNKGEFYLKIGSKSFQLPIVWKYKARINFKVLASLIRPFLTFMPKTKLEKKYEKKHDD
jgi:hypothetical protein